jgi:hypothetical protein
MLVQEKGPWDVLAMKRADLRAKIGHAERYYNTAPNKVCGRAKKTFALTANTTI